MKMDAGMDTGGILVQQKIPIRPPDNSETLHDRLGKMGADLLVRTIPEYVQGAIQPRSQPAEGVSYAPKIKKEHGQIQWDQPARSIWNRVRGLVPWPGAFTCLPDQPQPHLLKIWEAEVAEQSGNASEVLSTGKTGIVVGCGSGALRITVLQREGGRRLTAQQFLAGHSMTPGQRLGSIPD